MSSDQERWNEFSSNILAHAVTSSDGKTFMAKLKARATTGLRKTGIRTVYWKVFLGLLGNDTDKWLESQQAHRDDYHKLRQEYMTYDSADADLTVDNPLSQSKESRWNRYFADNELLHTIQLDLSRTYPDNPFFQREDVMSVMRNVLLVWAKLHPHVAYRQGMNELLAPVVMICFRESRKKISTDGEDVLANLLDDQFVEHDAFAIFRRMMLVMGQYFSSKRPQGSDKKGGLGGLFDEDESKQQQQHNDSAIVAKNHFIHHQLLPALDPGLYEHLQEMEVQPNIYLLRWFRLLFSREFHIEDVILLWDGIFAQNEADLESAQAFALTDFICVAMLLYVRPQLMDGDSMSCMRRLLRFPPVEDVYVIVERAMALQQSKPTPLSSSASASSASSAASSASGSVVAHPVANSEEAPKRGPGQSAISVLSDAVAKLNPFNKISLLHSSNSPPPHFSSSASASAHPHYKESNPRVAILQTQLEQSRAVMEGLGGVLEGLVEKMQRAYTEFEAQEPSASSSSDFESSSSSSASASSLPSITITALATLKQVKDVLLGRLAPHEFLPHLKPVPQEEEPVSPPPPQPSSASSPSTLFFTTPSSPVSPPPSSSPLSPSSSAPSSSTPYKIPVVKATPAVPILAEVSDKGSLFASSASSSASSATSSKLKSLLSDDEPSSSSASTGSSSSSLFSSKKSGTLPVIARGGVFGDESAKPDASKAFLFGDDD